MSLKKQFIAVFTLITLCASAQQTDSVRYPTFKVDGSMKNKFEYASETGKSRFSVRNSRIGVRGSLTETVSYRGQLELSDNGNFRVLDLYGTLKLLKGFNVSLGQVKVPLFNDYITAPADMMFANRAFIGKYFLSTRDLGLNMKYDFGLGSIPSRLEFGVYNGNVINAPVWSDRLSYGGRVELGTMKGFRTTAKFYDYSNSPEVHYLFYGADLRYATDNWRVETELLRRDNKNDQADRMLSYYVQTAYIHPLKKSGFFKNVIPAIRWDAIDKDAATGGFDVNRFTVGVGFGLTQKFCSSLIRFDYEKYFVNHELDILSKYPEMDSDKFTVELLLTF